MSGAAALPEEADLLAAEYVLGVLDGDDRRAVAARAAADPALRTAIAAWERRLAPLAMLVPPVEPPADLWPRLARDIGAPRLRLIEGSERPLRMWRGAAVAAMALAAGLAIMVVLPPAPSPVVVAALAPISAAAPAFIVRVLPNGALRIAPLAPAPVPRGHDLELWALPAGATRPVSLGVLPVSGVTVAATALTAPGGQILVSLEPKGGSPTGQPTGPVLYGGTITRLVERG